MKTHPLKPRKALNKAFLKVKPRRSDMERFKANLINLLEQPNDTESEEFHKNLVSDFLKRTCYATALEQGFDRLVHGLYGLTEEEIGILENASK